MTTVIIPGAPVARPGPIREVLPRPPSLTYSGQQTRAYREWYRKYGTLINYKSYKRTRKWRAGGTRHGYSGDYTRNYVERDPIGYAFKDVGRWGYNTSWGLGDDDSGTKPGTIIRSNEYDPYRTQKGDIIWDGNSWQPYYDKDSIHKVNLTDHYDQRDARMRNTWESRNPWDYYNPDFRATSRHYNDSRRWMPGAGGQGGQPGSNPSYIISKPFVSRKRTKAMKRTMRYRRFRPGFFNRDDHY